MPVLEGFLKGDIDPDRDKYYGVTIMRLCLYQPDIPQNTGAAIRLCAGLGVPLDIIEPCGFPLDDAKLRRVAMDYGAAVDLVRHDSWDSFLVKRSLNSRLILMTTKASLSYTEFQFQPDDILIAGRESSGVPQDVHDRVDARVIVPIKTRSFNVIVASGIILSEALRQIA
jgi:tRNA (cytidine/uridine-2'-O-)-methyltransferase